MNDSAVDNEIVIMKMQLKTITILPNQLKRVDYSIFKNIVMKLGCGGKLSLST